jgi:hypothetical protein
MEGKKENRLYQLLLFLPWMLIPIFYRKQALNSVFKSNPKSE